MLQRHSKSTPEANYLDKRRPTWLCVYSVAMMVMVCCSVGCSNGRGEPISSATIAGDSENRLLAGRRIIAQGQIVPRAGILRMQTTPGDIVEEILVNPGEPVAKGQELVRLRSSKLRAAQLMTLERRLAEAESQQTVAVDQARLNVEAAKVQARQAEAQVESLNRQQVLLDLAEGQLEHARLVLRRMESTAADALTKSFVSQIEIDRQLAVVKQAELEYRRQEDALLSAQDAGKWSQTLAQQQTLRAQAALDAVVNSAAVDIIRSELASTQLLNEQARVKSPIDGIVLSVDTSVGDTTSQIPLVQLSDISRMSCEAEVYQTDAARVRVGQRAVLRSDAFEGELSGEVQRIDRVVGRPKLRPTDPLARVDYRTLPVVISVSPKDAAKAANWLHLQVEVEIQLDASDSGLPAQRALDGTSPDNRSRAGIEG